MRWLFIILSLWLLCGCYNQRKAQQQVAKADASYPSIIAELCAEKFPITEKIVKGDSVFKTDTVSDMIFIPADTVTINDTVRITKTLPGKTITVTNTIIRTDTIYKENTAALAACALARDNAIKLALAEKTRADKWKKRADTRGIILLGLILAFGVWGYFKIKGK